MLFNTHAHHYVLLMHMALLPWKKGTLLKCEQNKSSALKLVSGAIGHRKANTWRPVGTVTCLVNSDRADGNRMLRKMGEGRLAQLRVSGRSNGSDATLKTG